MKKGIKISQFTLDGIFIKTFESARLAGKQFGGKNSDWQKIVTALISTNKKTKGIAHGYLWKYAE